MTYSRRTALQFIGATALGSIGLTTARVAEAGNHGDGGDGGDGGQKDKGDIRKMGHSLLSDPPGGYAEEDIRSDGQYALMGSFTGPGGSFLVDISNPTDPTEVHEFPTPSNGVRHADVEFDRRDGLYYRTREGGDDDPDNDIPPNGVDVIDYGWSDGTPENPVKASRIPAGSTHNVHAHPEGDVLYTTEHHGVGVWDTSDPTDVTGGDVFGPEGDLHDMVVDPDKDLLHCAFIGGGFTGYVIMDISDPMDPTATDQYETDLKADEANGAGFVGEAPMAWGVNYADERDFTVVSDMQTGIYVLKFTPSAAKRGD